MPESADLVQLGESIRSRRVKYDMSPADLAGLVTSMTGKSMAKSTVYSVEVGEASQRTALKVLRALEQWEAENGYDEPDAPELAPQLVTFRLTQEPGGGVTVTAEGPVENLDQLRDEAARLWRQIRDAGSDNI